MTGKKRASVRVALAASVASLMVFALCGRAEALTFSGSTLPTGADPFSIATGDVNLDGHLDLVVPNFQDDTLTVLLGDGAGGFTPAAGSPVPAGSAFADAVAITDLNGDGKPDLAVDNQANQVSILLGDGTGAFTAAVGSPFSTGGNNSRSIAVADYNGDGRPDIAVANLTGNYISILFNNGGGTFTTPSSVNVGVQQDSVATADFNGDGKADLVTANVFDQSISIFFGDGTGGFTQATGSPNALGTNSFPNQVIAKDFDGNGTPDVVVNRSGASDVEVFRNNGTGVFTSLSGPFSAATTSEGVASGDFNGDGLPDLVSVGSNGADILLNTGPANFVQAAGNPAPLGADPLAAVSGDFNEDGKIDFAANNSSDNNVSVLLNTSIQQLDPGTPPPNFGNQNVGTVGPAETITLDGGTGLTTHITRITTAGANPDDFLITQDHCTDATLGDGHPQMCSFGVRFAPSATGTRSANVQVFSATTFSPTEIAVSGTGGPADTTPPAITITGPVRTFSRTPTFTFTFSEDVSSVRCKIDSGTYVPCGDRYTTPRLTFGPHTIYVQATDDSGNVGTNNKPFTVRRRR